MKKLAEPLFDLLYLAAIFSCGFVMLYQANGNIPCLLFGMMALVLGAGDLLHLLPRVYSLCSGANPIKALGAGKWAASITATVYYALLYEAWRVLFAPEDPFWRIVVWTLTCIRIFLCCLPVNRWLQGTSPSQRWTFWRNLPFLLLGAVVAVLFAFSGSEMFRYLPLAVFLSFACYLTTAFGARYKPALGMLMIPKTLLYLWIQFMGLGLLPQ